ncbi:uncharacterized protein VP01_4215g2 [Puccinia sorghi]|uniref:Uncharacterized protein n=1 Tax=Puccinia sorghi TaxID=27349 RepID=A0A0L6UQP0_9BASI|nr:uncharacterized protein VP01_4215g2 [Puccinia sorghi]
MIDSKLTYMEMFSSLDLKAASTLKQPSQLGNSRWGLWEHDRTRQMEAVMLPRVLHGPSMGKPFQCNKESV